MQALLQCRQALDNFFFIVDLDGQAVRGVRKGWLTHQSEIQFRLHGSPLCLFGRKELVEKWNVSCSVLNISVSS